MISILRSNQPIAWALIPLTILLGSLGHLWVGSWDGLSAVVHGMGLTAWAFVGHRIYVNRHFVDRGDSALAWLVAMWCVCWLPPVGLFEGIRMWSSLLLVSFSLSVALQMHRQSSTSGIQFRSGALAGIATVCDPGNWGIALGLIAMQLYLRPGITREWIMLFIGWSWGGGVALALSHFFWAGNGAAPPEFLAFETSNGLHWAAIGWAVGGTFALLRQQSSLNLRSQNARLSVWTFAWLLAAGSMLHWSPWGVSVESIAFSPALALALAFSTVALVPKRDRNRRSVGSWHDAVFWALVGTVLVLFVQQLLT